MIESYDEWSPLKRIIVGRADYANWPINDPVFKLEGEKTLWKETPVPTGPVPQWIIDETEEDLHNLTVALDSLNVEVVRPDWMNFQIHDGMYNYCPRDRLLIYGDTVIDPAMMYPCRDMEYQCYIEFLQDAGRIINMPRNQGMTLDAANVLRLGKGKMLFLESASGNRAAYEWLCKQLPDVEIELCNFYSGVHIDSTITPLREGFVILNASRVTPNNCPKVFDGWEKLYISEVEAQDFYQYPYASKWIGLNMLSVDGKHILVDKNQPKIIDDLDRHGFTPIPLELRHSRTLGGGFHCVTLDLVRTAKY
jgi:N-dimethylarginine dimethylaminohydrolase